MNKRTRSKAAFRRARRRLARRVMKRADVTFGSRTRLMGAAR